MFVFVYLSDARHVGGVGWGGGWGGCLRSLSRHWQCCFVCVCCSSCSLSRHWQCCFVCVCSSCTCLMGGVGWGGVGGGGDVYVRCHAIDNVVSSVCVVPHVRCHAIDNVVSSVSVPRVPVWWVGWGERLAFLVVCLCLAVAQTMHKVIVASFGRRVPKKKHLKLQARRQRVKKVMKMLRGVPKTHVLGQPYSVLCSRFMMDFNQNVQKSWVFEEIDFIGANAMRINARPLTGAVTMFNTFFVMFNLFFVMFNPFFCDV